MKPLLIGISGKKRHGKDQLAAGIKRRLPSSERIAFADALKKEVACALGINQEQIENNKHTFRHILQAWGVLRRDAWNPEYWINDLAACCLESNKDVVIIPDVRFKNELDYIKSNNGITIRINRPGFPSDDRHVSETELDNEVFDFHYDCITLDDIDKAAESFCNYLKTKQ